MKIREQYEPPVTRGTLTYYYPLLYYYETFLGKIISTEHPVDFFATLKPNIILFHNYHPNKNNTIPENISNINDYVNYQWRLQFPSMSSSFNFEISYLNKTDKGGSIYIQEISYRNYGGSRFKELQNNTNHLITTLSIIFSICPFSNVTVLYSKYDSLFYNDSFYKSLLNELKDEKYNDFIFFTNIAFLNIIPPSPNFQNLFDDEKGRITIPMFFAVGNSGWSIDNISINNSYDLFWFVSYFVCQIGANASSSSCAFLDVQKLQLQRCPVSTEILLKPPSFLQSYFFRSNRYACYQPCNYQGSDYQQPYNQKLPDNYKNNNQFRVPDVYDHTSYISLFNQLIQGTSLSVIMFSMCYAVAKIFYADQFIILPSSNYLTQMYYFQKTVYPPLFLYNDSSQCQINRGPTLDPSNIDCCDYPEYVIERDMNGKATVGLNVVGLGKPLWTNWKR